MPENNDTLWNNSTSELQVRRDKLAALVAAGHDPFTVTKYDVTGESADIVREFEQNEEKLTEEGRSMTVRVAGRLTSRRNMG